MTEEQESFAITITGRTESHEDWLDLVRFGLGTLIWNEGTFIHIVVQEAEEQIERKMIDKCCLSEEIASIFDELGVRFVAKGIADAE